jgi:hypothetical protein
LSLGIQLIEVLTLQEEPPFNLLTIGFLQHELVLKEFHIIVDFFNRFLPFFSILCMSFCYVIEPECCVPDLIQALLELLNLYIFLRFLLLEITWVNF